MRRRSLVCLLLALLPSVSFAAEPLTLLLMHILREQIASAIQEAIENAEREKERQKYVIPPPVIPVTPEGALFANSQ